jgi:hypothetical protein
MPADGVHFHRSEIGRHIYSAYHHVGRNDDTLVSGAVCRNADGHTYSPICRAGRFDVVVGPRLGHKLHPRHGFCEVNNPALIILTQE